MWRKSSQKPGVLSIVIPVCETNAVDTVNVVALEQQFISAWMLAADVNQRLAVEL